MFNQSFEESWYTDHNNIPDVLQQQQFIVHSLIDWLQLAFDSDEDSPVSSTHEACCAWMCVSFSARVDKFSMPTKCWFDLLDLIYRVGCSRFCCGPFGSGGNGGLQARCLNLLFKMVECCRHIDRFNIPAGLHSLVYCADIFQTVETKRDCVYRGWCHLFHSICIGLFPLSTHLPS